MVGHQPRRKKGAKMKNSDGPECDGENFWESASERLLIKDTGGKDRSVITRYLIIICAGRKNRVM